MFKGNLIDVICAVLTCSVAIGQVYIPDPGLRAAIESVLGTSEPNLEDMQRLVRLDAGARQIKDLTGLEYATNLESLYLAYNQIEDISALSGLFNLNELDLSRNQIRDIRPIRGLSKLTNLDLDYNYIEDIEPLGSLTGLIRLDLDSNLIEDLSAISGIYALEELWVCSNRIHDISPLSSLTQLKRLDLESNSITDISALADLVHLEALWLGYNKINDIGPISGLKALRQLGLEGNALVDIWPLSLLSDLQYLDLTGNSIEDISALAALANLRSVSLGRNQVTSIAPIAGLSSLITLDITDNPLDAQTCQVYIPQMLAANPHLSILHNSCRSAATVAIEAGPGGYIGQPGDGVFQFQLGQSIVLEARAMPGFTFSHWSGDASGSQNPIELKVEGDIYVKANFLSLSSRIYVDADLAGFEQDGSVQSPFSSIQMAIDVARDGTTILVGPGTYRESIRVYTKSVNIVGAEPNGQPEIPWPVITGTSGGPAIELVGQSMPSGLTGLIITNGTARPVCGLRFSNTKATLRHCLIVANGVMTDAKYTIECRDSNVVFVNCTIADNVSRQFGACLYLANSLVEISNSIIWGNQPQEIIVGMGQVPTIRFSDINGGWNGIGNINQDPLFVRGGSKAFIDGRFEWVHGDYHLKSQWGRYDVATQRWVYDPLTSGCIDAGDPDSVFLHEPRPNGGKVNIGAYGGTTQASKSGRWD